ncbi:hypothetical protein Lal_00036040 [Lupinus albus]|uniref:glycerophosphodiester phosphodiesterase n=2 Tax=Lupinus albus TaxID=3870 RepID=A0A6A5MD54_LUPAL|nr:putative glycerophosphodiester phosphodiesterase [Lupinus albus]KAF1868602.1 hypothetical protein Lal_00036040 [Lupinus albus]
MMKTMRDFRAFSNILNVLLILHSLVPLISSSGWKTLQGSPPVVIARGGFSGIFPDSSLGAYNLALETSVPNVILWCDVQLTKDEVGICFPHLKLDNATDISFLYPASAKNYSLNGIPTKGWFSFDYNLTELADVSLLQGVYSRTSSFDGNHFRILTVEDVVKLVKPPSPGLWLNVQNEAFIQQQNLSTKRFLSSLSTRGVSVSYISSPDVGFLSSMKSVFNPRTTGLVFRFLRENEIEPTTNQTYGSLLKNLAYIRTFASGILVPKGYIWPVNSYLYLQPYTSIVSDAHKEGLQVFVSDLVNDVPFSYNFSYDPLAECLAFIDNGKFSVDGVLSDFPITPSAAINCFSGLERNARKQVDTLIISKYGASGDYPACTDLSYKKAILDGADVVDCPIQMSKDGIPFCLSSIDLVESTTVAESNFSNLRTTIPEIKSGSGIYAFSLKWNDIKTLTPSILSPYSRYGLNRNPKFRNQGKLLTLSDFLSLTKGQTSGVLISIENAAYLEEKQGLSVTNAVLNALQKVGCDKPGSQKVMIQSSHSSVLKIFKEKSKYERLYKVDKSIGDALDSAVEDIKSFSDSVVIGKASVIPQSEGFLVNYTNTVTKLQSFNLSVYVETFSNEFVSQAWDYYSDAFVEINSFVVGAKVNGIITDFPKTADRYRKNLCLKEGKKPAYMSPVEPGKLLQQISKAYFPPPSPPLPVLTDTNVTEPPLPSVPAPTTAPAPTTP